MANLQMSVSPTSPMQVTVVDGNNITVTLDRGVAGVGISSIQLVTIDSANYLEITYTDTTIEIVGPVGIIQYNAVSPITITGAEIGLDTVPVAKGGTGQITANAGFNALAPVQTSQSGKYLKTDGTDTSWDAIDISTADVTGTLPVLNGGTGVTTSTGTGSVVLSNSPALVTPTGIVKGDVGLGNVDNTSDANKPVSTAQATAIGLKVTANADIIGATKTKITYDAKGLVASGTDATTADIADSTNKRYVTDAQITAFHGVNDVNTSSATAAQGAKADSALQPAAIGVTVQAYDADLTTWAGITPGTGVGTALSNTAGAANGFATYNQLGSAAFTASTAYDPAGAAAAITPTTLGLVIGTNVQAYDDDLTTWAGITPGTGIGTALAVAVGTDGAPVIKGGALGTPSSGSAANLTSFPTLNQNTTGTAAGLSATLAITSGGTGATTAADARSNLGLGSAAVLTAGAALGAATLDGGGTVPTAQLPAAVLGSVKYQGTWNATTNSPALASGVGTQGYYYVVATAGATNLDGITDWKIGDWAIFGSTTWQKIDNTDAVNSVNGYTGTVSLAYADLAGSVPTWNQNTTGNAATVTGLSVASGKTLTANNTLTLSGTDSSTLNVGTGGTLGTAAYTATTAYATATQGGKADTALQPSTAITVTSVNGNTITTGTGTLTIAAGKTFTANDTVTVGTGGLVLGNSGGLTAAASKVLTVNNSLTLSGTDSSTLNVGTGGTLGTAAFTAASAYVPATQNTLTQEPTGFASPDAVISTYDPTTRTVTLTGTVSAYWQGTLIPALVSGWVSAAHTATTGGWYLSYNGSAFVWSQSPWTFDQLQIGYVWYGASDKYGIRETHGLMQWQVHEEFHQTTGTYLVSGGDLAGYVLASTTAANRRPTITATTVQDEDLETINAALTSSLYTQLYLTGAGATPTWTVDAAEIVPVLAANPYYNSFTGGTWGQTLLANSAYMAVWLVAVPTMSSVTGQKYRYQWIQGQSSSTTLATIQAQIPSGLNLAGLTGASTEWVFIAKIIIRFNAGNWTFIQVDKLLGNKSSTTTTPAGTYLSAVTTDANFTGDGTAANPLALAATITANVTGNVSGSAATVTGATQAAITSANGTPIPASSTLVTTATLNGGTLPASHTTLSATSTARFGAAADAAGEAFEIAKITAGAVGPIMTLSNRSTSNNSAGTISLRGKTSGGAENDYAYINLIAADTTAKTGRIDFQVGNGSSPATALSVSPALASVTGLLDLSAATSGQIKFPATQNASSDPNTLDDYEEGTWTATVNTGSISSQSCKYTKVGRSLTVTGTVTFGGTTEDPSIRSMPFNSMTGGEAAAAIYTASMDVSSGGPIQGFVSGGSNVLNVYGWLNDSLSVARQSGGEFTFSLTYFTA